MQNPQESWPLDDPEHLADALREQGTPEDEIGEAAASLMRLASWHAPAPTTEDTLRLVDRLMSSAPATSPVARPLQVHPAGLLDEFHLMLRLVRTQVSMLQPSFWLVSALVIVLGGLIVLSVADLNQAFILQVIGPLLSYIGTAGAFRAAGLNMLEFELACPPTPRQLTLARLIIIISYDAALGMLLTLLLWSQQGIGLWFIALHWLAPLLLGVGLTLFLSLRIPISQAAAITYTGWLAILVSSLKGQNNGQGLTTTLTTTTELALCVVGIVFIGFVLLYMPKALIRMIPRQ